MKISILYVEDEQGVREKLGKFIKRFSSEFYVASDGKEGLELYEKNRVDLVISDIKMPKLDGIEMAKSIRMIDKEQNIIFTTAHSEDVLYQKAIEPNVDGYILKPVDYEKLEEAINSVITKKSN